jgi:hypothetical protein
VPDHDLVADVAAAATASPVALEPDDRVVDEAWIWSRPRGVCALDGCSLLQGIAAGVRPMEYCTKAHYALAKYNRQQSRLAAASLRQLSV